MQYTKPMIDLVYEIRRRVDADMKPNVKMANLDVLTELAGYHHRAGDTITATQAGRQGLSRPNHPGRRPG